jgi:DNA invertase Pin-like site-specific DNA recombinase
MQGESAKNRLKTKVKPKVKHPPAVYSYTRFSTAIQKKGTGTRRQVSLADAYCDHESRQWSLTKDYKDLGVSAFKGKNATHGELAVFLRLIQDGRIVPGSVLLVESLDRLSRDNINKALELFLSIINAGVVVITLCDEAEYRADTDPHTLMAQMMISLAIFLRANDESRMKSQRRKKAWEYALERAKDGKYHGGRLPKWIAADSGGNYFLIEKEANVIRQFFELYNQGYGCHVIAKRLGIPKSTLDNWAVNETVIGTLTVGQETAKPAKWAGHYPAVITRDVWETAQRKRQERQYGGKRSSPTAINLFQGILFYGSQRMILSDGSGCTKAARKNFNYLKVYEADGLTVRVDPLEYHILWNHLWDRFVEQRVTTVESGPEPKRLAALNAKVAELQRAMGEDSGLIADLVPVLKDVRRQAEEMKRQTRKVEYTTQDPWVIYRAVGSTETSEEKTFYRVRLRELIRDTIERVDVLEVTGRRYRFIRGRFKLTDGTTTEFRVAYDSWRYGLVPCDGKVSGFDPRDKLANVALGYNAIDYHVISLDVTGMCDEVMTELKKLKLRRPAVLQPWTEQRREAFKPIAKAAALGRKRPRRV